MPVQRIPRYSMLLQDMVKNTWSHHGDYAALSQALKTILELASYVHSIVTLLVVLSRRTTAM